MLKYFFLLSLLLPGCLRNKTAPDSKTAFLLYEEGQGFIVEENKDLLNKRLSPCSTFKVPHAIFGLDSGFLTGKNFVLKYKSQRDPIQDFWPSNWPQNHNLESAVKNSVVWYFKETARNIGSKKMKSYLKTIQFGNQEISGGIDSFWLGSSLKISAYEQIEVWRNLFGKTPPFKKEHVDIVKEIIVEEKSKSYTLRAKTGACTQADNSKSAWWVGSVAQNGKTYYFTGILLGQDFTQLFQTRKKLIRLKLKHFGLLKTL